MKEPKITENKIERTLFRMKCPYCKEDIKGTTRKHLKHNYGMHLFYCPILKKKAEDTKA